MQSITSAAVDFAAPTSKVAGHTRFGKAITIARARLPHRGFTVVVAGGGTKPPALDGTFTSMVAAEDAVKRYLDTIPDVASASEQLGINEDVLKALLDKVDPPPPAEPAAPSEPEVEVDEFDNPNPHIPEKVETPAPAAPAAAAKTLTLGKRK